MKEFFGNKINIDIEKVKIARIGDIVTTDNNQPIVATCDIKSCIAVLIICENEASLTHIETSDEKEYEKGKKTIETMHQTIKSPIKYKLVFYGHDKKDKQCNEVCQMLNTHNIYPAYLYELNNANGSIVYDFSTNQFYGMDEDRLFYEYELGSINKKLDPLEEYYRNGYTK